MGFASMAASQILIATGIALALSLQGCTTICNHNVPATCSAALVGKGGCESLKGATHEKNVKTIQECRTLCGKKKDCAFYAYCEEDERKCGVFKHMCGLVANEKCKLTTSLGRTVVNTYKMFDVAAIQDAEEQVQPNNGNGFAFAGGAAVCLMVSGAAVAFAVRSWRNRRDIVDEEQTPE